MSMGQETIVNGVIQGENLPPTPLLEAKPLDPNHLPPNIFACPIKDIFISPDRGRKKFENVQALADTIQRNGQFHPIIVRWAFEGEATGGKTYVLVAGERRYRAISIVLRRGTIFAILREKITPLQSKEIELEETLNHERFDPYEEAELWRQIDEIKRRVYGEKPPGSDDEAPGWTTAKTAQLVQVPESTVRRQIKVAKALKANPLLREQVQHLPVSVALRKIQDLGKVARANVAIADGSMSLTASLRKGDAVDEIKKEPDNSIDLIITDPPTGIGQIEDETGSTRGDKQSYTGLLKQTDNLSYDETRTLMMILIPEFFRVLKPSSHIYIFMSHDHLQFVTTLMRDTGFHVDPWWLIWDKEKPTTMFKGLSYSPQYEPIIFGHKPPRTRHLSSPSGNILRCPPIHATKKTHPFQKPFKLLSALIERSSRPGEKVFDPFAGSAATLKAAKRLNRSALGFELDEENWTRGQMNLTLSKDSPLMNEGGG